MVGAGIAGLGAAYALQQSGHQVVVLEQDPVVGGRMQTCSAQGFTWDPGAQFMLPQFRAMRGLMAELGVGIAAGPPSPFEALAVPAPGHRLLRARFDSPAAVLRHPGITLRSKWRMTRLLLFALRNRHRLDFRHPERAAPLDMESIRTWGDREIGADAVDYYLSLPFSSLFFWRPEETPLWLLGSFVLMSRRWRVLVPQGGMGAVPVALAGRLDVRLNTAVRRVDLLPDGTAALRLHEAGGRAADLRADRVVLAVPAPAALPLLAAPDRALGPLRAAYLRSVRYTRNATTAVAYRRAPDHQAYGVTIPQALRQPLATIAWEQNKVPGRAPPGAGLGILMPTDAWSSGHWHLSDDQTAAQLVQAAARYYPGSNRGVRFQQVHRWEYALPHFPPGRTQELAAAWAAGPAPGSPVHVCGDYWLGPSTEMALVSGLRAAEEVLRHV